MPSRRTVKKPTRWTPEEWRRIEDAAETRGVPPLRHVREAALAAELPPPTRRRGSSELLRQLSPVLNNLNQLRVLAEEDGAQAALVALETTIGVTTAAAKAVAGRPGSTHPLIVALSDAGRSLNELAHRAHVSGELPGDGELSEALVRIQRVVGEMLR